MIGAPVLHKALLAFGKQKVKAEVFSHYLDVKEVAFQLPHQKVVREIQSQPLVSVLEMGYLSEFNCAGRIPPVAGG